MDSGKRKSFANVPCTLSTTNHVSWYSGQECCTSNTIYIYIHVCSIHGNSTSLMDASMADLSRFSYSNVSNENKVSSRAFSITDDSDAKRCRVDHSWTHTHISSLRPALSAEEAGTQILLGAASISSTVMPPPPAPPSWSLLDATPPVSFL